MRNSLGILVILVWRGSPLLIQVASIKHKQVQLESVEQLDMFRQVNINIDSFPS